MKNNAQASLSFRKESISELNADTMKAVNSGASTTVGTTSTIIIIITDIIRNTTVTY